MGREHLRKSRQIKFRSRPKKDWFRNFSTKNTTSITSLQPQKWYENVLNLHSNYQGKRKKSAKRATGKKKLDPLPTQFACLFCNHDDSVVCKLDKVHRIGNLICKVCGQGHQCVINSTPPNTWEGRLMSRFVGSYWCLLGLDWCCWGGWTEWRYWRGRRCRTGWRVWGWWDWSMRVFGEDWLDGLLEGMSFVYIWNGWFTIWISDAALGKGNSGIEYSCPFQQHRYFSIRTSTPFQSVPKNLSPKSPHPGTTNLLSTPSYRWLGGVLSVIKWVIHKRSYNTKFRELFLERCNTLWCRK